MQQILMALMIDFDREGPVESTHCHLYMLMLEVSEGHAVSMALESEQKAAGAREWAQLNVGGNGVKASCRS